MPPKMSASKPSPLTRTDSIMVKTNISTDKVIFLKKIKEINPKVIVIANETNKHKDTLLDLEKKFNNKNTLH